MDLDPIAAYDRIAPLFRHLTEERMAYLNRIDELVVSNIPPGSSSLLDVGAGDGRRARRIAEAAGLTTTVLIEPSLEMQNCAEARGGFRTMRAEQLDSIHESFDIITCLWNVLGHVFPTSSRVEVLRQFARLAAPGGRILLDVTHRYNAAQYGFFTTAARFLYDTLSPSETNGDVVAAWHVGQNECRTRGHVFIDSEFRNLASAAGLNLEKRMIVDYADGSIRNASFQGNLFYVLSADLRPEVPSEARS